MLASYLHAHAARRAFHHSHRRIDVVGVEVLHLDLRYLLHLRPAECTNLLPLLRGAALLDAQRLADQVRGRRRLQCESERAVFEDDDFDGYDAASLAGGALVVLLAERHDVGAVLAKRRPHRWRRCRLPRLQLKLDDCSYLLSHQFSLSHTAYANPYEPATPPPNEGWGAPRAFGDLFHRPAGRGAKGLGTPNTPARCVA